MQALPLKTLIADHGVSFDASTIMTALVKAGLVENFEYASTTGSGAQKSFRRLTSSGEQFGLNKPSMHPFKTEARFYAGKFPEMLSVVVEQLRKEVDELSTSQN